MFKEFMMKQMLQRQLKSLPADEREKIIDTISKNPEFFAKMAQELEAEVKSGKSQMDAAMSVAQKYQTDLQKILGGETPR
jgi:hypothetical protein